MHCMHCMHLAANARPYQDSPGGRRFWKGAEASNPSVDHVARSLPGPQERGTGGTLIVVRDRGPRRGTISSSMYRKNHYAPYINMVHNGSMRTRTNLHIDNDALAFASSYANAKGVSLGIAVSELIRRAERTTGQEIPSPRLIMNLHGYLEIADTGDRITPEMVKEASEDALV